MIYEIIKVHGEEIKVQAKEGKVSKLIINLPCE